MAALTLACINPERLPFFPKMLRRFCSVKQGSTNLLGLGGGGGIRDGEVGQVFDLAYKI